MRRRQNRVSARAAAPEPARSLPAALKEEPLPLPSYCALPIAEEHHIPHVAGIPNSYTRDTAAATGLNTHFTQDDPQTPTVPQFAFQPQATFPSTSYIHPAAENVTGSYEHQYFNGYYRTENWPTTTNGTRDYIDNNANASYEYYAPTEHSQKSQYDNRDRASPPHSQYYNYHPNSSA